jgi:hypothetical protein
LFAEIWVGEDFVGFLYSFPSLLDGTAMVDIGRFPFSPTFFEAWAVPFLVGHEGAVD